jgi:zinc protease
MRSAVTQTVSPYMEKAIAKQLLARDTVPGRLLSSALSPSINLTTLTFANGTRVLLKPTDFKNDEVLLTAFRDGGTNRHPVIDSLNADFAASLDGITGLGTFTPNDLPKVLAGKSVSINAGLTASSDEFSGRASAADLESMLQLLYLQFTDVRQDPALFAAFSGKVKPLLAASGNNPNTAFADFYNRQLYAGHPRSGVLPTQAQMDALRFDRAYAINREHFGNANGFTFVLVGAFDLDKAKALVTRYIGGLPSDVSKSFNAVDTGMRPIKTSKRVDFAKGSEPKSTTLLKYTGEIEHYDLAEDFKLYLLEEVLKIKLTESLREQLSGVYTVGVGSGYARLPYPNYSITLSIPSAPENVDALVAAAKKEIDALRRQGPSPADFAKVKENYLTGLAIRQKENSYWLGKLAQFDENGMDPALIPDYNRRLLAAMTIGDLQQAAERYFDPQRVFEAVLKPEAVTP